MKIKNLLEKALKGALKKRTLDDILEGYDHALGFLGSSS